jgi:hypothetical protein
VQVCCWTADIGCFFWSFPRSGLQLLALVGTHSRGPPKSWWRWCGWSQWPRMSFLSRAPSAWGWWRSRNTNRHQIDGQHIWRWIQMCLICLIQSLKIRYFPAKLWRHFCHRVLRQSFVQSTIVLSTIRSGAKMWRIGAWTWT